MPLDGLKDEKVRAFAYLQALQNWVQWVMEKDESVWNSDPEVIRARQGVKKITGKRFESRDSLRRWWIDNGAYLIWSPTEERLVVDAAAKQAGRLSPLNVRKITASQYWSLLAQGFLEDVRDEGEYLLAKAWFPPHQEYIRVAKDRLNDRTVKEEGFRHALAALIDRVSLPDFHRRDVQNQADAQSLIRQLRVLTGERFTTAQAWIDWWNRNKDHLVLSSDGKHLVSVGKER